ncbi:DUF7694 domain-containing protein [Bifidobacterium parmae]|uniref:DUF7694 domain-containing protein n=1 Tax=Bifidobacterium parmae TaxID=361854 RepID=A0A2N5IVN6_9BIFI|nr:hypothetical protein [Bifidobacterium parmae]PLS26016.1 hypothetical protein Uis4E_2191 [Bifidobacterium parmae]
MSGLTLQPVLSRHMKPQPVTEENKRFMRAASRSGPPLKVWRSRDYFAQLYRDRNGYLRLSVNRVGIDLNGRWKDGITWDELQRVKQETIGDAWAVEIYPPKTDLVDVANIRHLWILDQRPPYAWHDKKGQQ